jgi:hypothetical protein
MTWLLALADAFPVARLRRLLLDRFLPIARVGRLAEDKHHHRQADQPEPSWR